MRPAPSPAPAGLRAGLLAAATLLAPAAAPAPAQDATKAEQAAPKPADAPAPKPAPAPAPASATEPATRPGAWMRQHERFLARAATGDVDLLFLGDSITAQWSGARSTWDRYYGPRKAANFGIGGDRTQHVLWRLDHGEVDGIKPKVVVLMIGTNNLGANPEAEVADGVKAVVDRLRAKLPEAKVLLLGIFPRGARRNVPDPAVAPDPRVARVNSRLAALDDGKMVKYLDFGATFLDADGQVPRANMPDFLHLTPAAYQSWADAMEPTLWALMEAK